MLSIFTFQLLLLLFFKIKLKMLRFLSAFTALLLLTRQCSSQAAPPSPSGGGAPSSGESEEYLAAHNQARAEVGVGPLQWSPALAKSASLAARLQRDRQNCSFANLANSRYGGNQLWAGGLKVTPRAAVEAWIEEKQYYNYQNNSCAADRRCGVYTQVVWRKSLDLGCAQASCPKAQSSLTICFYNPPGNVVGEKPY
ncbi:STS14 protein-like [Andrographis paniculata]|uniref:STS14 protein-like n=1 Tax=Andrographis paniculata TaxID=175694 RepID=UPI0021E83539|nr:STS14 protein-like [Andrographis paniculata]